MDQGMEVESSSEEKSLNSLDSLSNLHLKEEKVDVAVLSVPAAKPPTLIPIEETREEEEDEENVGRKHIPKVPEVAAALRVLQEALPLLTEALPNSEADYDEVDCSGKLDVFQCRPRTEVRAKSVDYSSQFSNFGKVGKKRHSVAVATRMLPSERAFQREPSSEVPDETTALLSHRSVKRFTRKQWMTLVSMVLLDLTSYANMSILAPFFPDVVQQRNLSPTINGVIFSAYALVLVIASPIVGKLIPVFSPRLFYLSGIVLTGIGNICFGVIPLIEDNSVFIVISVFLRVMEALGASFFLTVIYALVPSIFPDDINTITGMLETAIGVGMCLGPAIGVWLYSYGGFALPFFVLGGFLLSVLPISCITFPYNRIAEFPEANFCQIFCKGGVLLASFSLVVVAICQSGLYPTLQPHMGKLGVSVKWVGMVFLLNSAVYSVSSPLVGLAVDRWKSTNTILISGLLLTSLGLVLLGNSPILPDLKKEALVKEDIVAIVLLGLSVAMCIVPTYSLMLQSGCNSNDVANPDFAVCAIVGGLWSSSYSLGDMIGPLYTGIMSSYTTFANTTTYTALLPLVMALVMGSYVALSKIRSRNSNRQDCDPA